MAVSRRRAVVLNHFAAPAGAPGGTRHVELAERVEGWDVVVVAADRNLLDRRRRPSDPPHFVVVPTTPHRGNGPGRVLSWIAFAAAASRWARRQDRVDLVVGSTPHLLAARAGLRVARRRGVPFVLEVRDPWPEVLVALGGARPGSPLVRALDRLARRLESEADAVVVLAEGVRDHLAARGVPPERLHVVPNGADPGALAPTADRNELRRRAGFAHDEVVAVYAGAHGPANGLDHLLDAAAALAPAHPELRVVLVGGGPDKERLARRVDHEGLASVELRDPVPKDRIGDLLGAADVGVHCLADADAFHWGVSPNKLFDYLACGLPVITNTPGEVAGLVAEAGAGEAVAPDGLADGLARLVDLGTAGRAEVGARGRAWLEANRSRARTAARFQAVLDALVPDEVAA